MKGFGAVNGRPGGIVAPTFGSIIHLFAMVWDALQDDYQVGPCHSHVRGLGPHADSVPQASFRWAHTRPGLPTWAHTMILRCTGDLQSDKNALLV